MALTLGRARWPRSKGKVFASWAPCLPHCSAIGETVSSLEQPQPQVPESEWPPQSWLRAVLQRRGGAGGCEAAGGLHRSHGFSSCFMLPSE